MNYYDEKLLMRHVDSLRNDIRAEFNDIDIQTLYSSKICNSLNSQYFNVDGSLKLKHRYNIPKIDMRSIMDSVVLSTNIQYTPTDVKLAQKMYDVWLGHEQAVEGDPLHTDSNDFKDILHICVTEDIDDGLYE